VLQRDREGRGASGSWWIKSQTGLRGADCRAECRACSLNRLVMRFVRGLENRYPSLGGSRVQIPPPPLNQAESRIVERNSAFRWQPTSSLTTGCDGLVRRSLSGSNDRATIAQPGLRRLACDRHAELVMCSCRPGTQTNHAGSDPPVLSRRDRRATLATLPGGRRRPLFLHPGLPSPGLGRQGAKDNPQDLPHTRRGPRVAPGKPNRAPQGNSARASPTTLQQAADEWLEAAAAGR